MSFSTFSGPLRSGTVKEGELRNTGTPELVQFYTIPASAILTAPAALVAARLPAGAKITKFTAEVVTALSTATNCAITFGAQGGSASLYMTSVNTGATVAKVAQATIDTATQAAATNNIGTADVAVTVTPTAATANATAGAIVVGVWYIQRAADGSANPATA